MNTGQRKYWMRNLTITFLVALSTQPSIAGASGRIYAASTEGVVVAINEQSLAEEDRIPIPGTARQMATSADGRWLWISGRSADGAGFLQRADTLQGRAPQTVSFVEPPARIALVEAQNLVYATLPNSGSVAIMDAVSVQLLDQIALDAQPYAIASLTSNAGNVLFVGMLDGLPQGPTYGEGGGEINDGHVGATAIAQTRFGKIVTFRGSFSGISLRDAAVTTDGRYIEFAGLHLFDGDYGASLFRVDTLTLSQIGERSFNDEGPAVRVLLGNGGATYVSEAFLWGSTGPIRTACANPGSAQDIALSRDGYRLYAASPDCDLSVIDAVTERMTATVSIKATAVTTGPPAVAASPKDASGCGLTPHADGVHGGAGPIILWLLIFSAVRFTRRNHQRRNELRLQATASLRRGD